MRPLHLTAAAAALLAAAPLVARAQTVTVLGGGRLAAQCSRAAVRGEVGAGALYACDEALRGEGLAGRDRAGTYVNRGVLRLLRREYPLAQADFDRAVAVDPAVGESYVDRGAALIAQRRFAAGVADIDRGLALHAGEPEKAYFNRALAREALGDAAGAYADYRAAAALKPAWPEPRAELARFTVTRRPAR